MDALNVVGTMAAMRAGGFVLGQSGGTSDLCQVKEGASGAWDLSPDRVIYCGESQSNADF